jgi:hypothetical protein
MNANGGKVMTGFSRASNAVAGGGALGWAIVENDRAHRVQHSRWRDARCTCAATALAALLIAGSSVEGLAQTANEVWAGCVLTTDAVAGLADSLAPIEGAEIAFVVVYSLNNDNDGQPVSGGFTGPVICTNPDEVSAPEPTTQTDNIGTPDDTVTILDAEEAFLLQYQFEAEPINIEKRFCHTVDSETDCFLIVPAGGEEPIP